MPYTTKWVQIVPEAGLECPVCKQGFLEEGRFGGVLCRNCQVVFKQSKFPAQEPQKTIGTAKVIEEKNQGELILASLKRIEDRLTELEKKSVIYPNEAGK